MHDFDFDVMQKKRIAQSARHRVCGSKSKRCTLPSDRLTPAQWKKKNGSVVTMNLNVPLSWSEFKSLPTDLQKEYLLRCITQFGCKMSNFSELFGVHHVTIKKKLLDLGIDMNFFKPGEKMSKDQRESFEVWLNRESDTAPVSEVEETENKPIEEHPVPHTVLSDSAENSLIERVVFPLNGMNHFEMEYEGDLDFAQIMMAIYQFADHSPVKLKISMEKVKKDV